MQALRGKKRKRVEVNGWKKHMSGTETAAVWLKQVSLARRNTKLSYFCSLFLLPRTCVSLEMRHKRLKPEKALNPAWFFEFLITVTNLIVVFCSSCHGNRGLFTGHDVNDAGNPMIVLLLLSGSQMHLHTRTTNKQPAKIKGEALFVLVQMRPVSQGTQTLICMHIVTVCAWPDTCLKSNLVETSSSLLVKWMKNESGLFHTHLI